MYYRLKKFMFFSLLFQVLCSACHQDGVLPYPDSEFWANSYFGQTSPYPLGSLNPAKKEYKYSIPRFVIQTDDGGYLVGGLIRTFEEMDAMLFMLDSTGEIKKGWSIHGGWQPGEDKQTGIITHLSDTGSYYIAAGWISRKGNDYIPSGNTHMWILKISYDGDIISNKSYGLTSFYDHFDDCYTGEGFLRTIVKTDDGFLLGGKLLVRIDNKGDVVWAKRFEFGEIFDMKLTSDGDIIIAACDEYKGFNRIVKTDLLGNVVWAVEYLLDDLAVSFRKIEIVYSNNNSEDGYLLGGSVTYPEARNSDCILVRIDSIGNMLWNSRYNSVVYNPDIMIFSDDEITSIVRTPDNNFLVGITTEGFNSKLNNDDAVVVKIKSDGSVLWQKAYDIFGVRMMRISLTEQGFVFTGDMGHGGDWHSLVVTADSDGSVPVHSSDLTIKDVSFMIDSPNGFIVKVSDEDILVDESVVVSGLNSTMRKLSTARKQR